jgi:hypothetical protein
MAYPIGMDALLWILLPGCVAAGAALLAFFIMQSRMEVMLAKEREATAQARGELEAQRLSIEERIKAAEEGARRQALDEFLQDIRIEERHYVRNRKMLFVNQKSVVLQERIFFRNIPLSNWVEHERIVDEGANVDDVIRSLSVFDHKMEELGPDSRKRRLLR